MPTIRINAQQSTGQTPHSLGLNLSWSKSAQSAITSLLARYPAERSRSALIPLLHLAQREFGGWLSVDAMQLVADTLGLPYIRVYEVASFYTMFNLQPLGKHHIQVCTNCACLIRGSDEIVKEVKATTGLTSSGQTTADGEFTFTEVECLGACVAAPMMQVTHSTGGIHYFTNLDAKKTREILKSLREKGEADKFADTPPAEVDPISHGKYAK
ncbi:MAG: NADH-quinone oxidoreductase subunit NuoE [Proteobacteria bacterium]|nr:NADH-quinone oxidoreductase subunit NuoE [Pseudomonadota bacterium]